MHDLARLFAHRVQVADARHAEAALAHYRLLPGAHWNSTTLTIAEMWRGVIEMASGRRRRNLEAWFAGAEGPPALFSGRVLSFDARAAMEWGRLMAAGTAAGRPRRRAAS